MERSNEIAMVNLDETISRFKNKFIVAQNGCHEWIGAMQSNGYARFSAFGRSMYAHRFSALLKFGIVKSSIDVCHKCDNRKCVNPDHLFLGTRKENMQDAVSKGRQAKGDKLSVLHTGDKCSFTKLTYAQVDEIRRLKQEGLKTKTISALFNVSADNIRKIVRFDTWRSANG